MVGCGASQPTVETAAVTHYRDGKVVLGSPSLTAGIPGNGPLSLHEIQEWLDEPLNHERLDFALPVALADEISEPFVPPENPLTRAKIELGRQLFFDKRLSGIGTFSCATCHRPEQSFTSHSVMPEVGRNASAVVNRVLGREHFWDGRASSLEVQPKSPIENPFEMNSSPHKSTANIQAIPGYRLQFERIFGEVTFENICKSLACFERAIVTCDSPWDARTMSEAAERGEQLFFSDRFGCSTCHVGRNLTDEDYHNLGVVHLKKYGDVGRHSVSNLETDRGAFKTPTLRNVAKTAPYMHNGALGTLEQVVDYFAMGGHPDAVDGEIGPIEMTSSEKRDLIEFLHALNSELPPIETGRLPE